MTGRLQVLAIAIVLAAVLAGASSAAYREQVSTSSAGRAQDPTGYIVVYRDSVAVDRKTEELERAEGFSAHFRYRHALKGFAAKLSQPQVDRLRADPDVAFLSEDRTVEAVGTVPLAAGETAPTGIRRVGAATTTTARERSTINVAVIDTGIDLTNTAELNAVSGTNCVRSGTAASDDNGHGTHVSGTIAAKNTGTGVAGVAPGTKLYAVKVLNAQGSGTWSQVICGIDWVTANAASLNIKVANMSLGGSGSNDNNCGNSNADALHKAICNSTVAGVTYAVAAGNSGTNFAGFVPAAYPEALTVTAMSDSDGAPGGAGGSPSCLIGESDDSYASFSNFAVATTEINHTIAGPGVCILSTWPGGYNTISGTSMATPHVAGTVALCLGEGGATGPCTGLSPAQIVQRLRNDAASYSNANPGYGFVGDPNHVVPGAYFGYLVAASASASSGPTITTSSLADGTVNSSYSQTLQATGGTPPYGWSIPSGSLPPGLGLNAATGTISGTPTTPGTYSFTAQVTDSAFPAQSSTRTLTISVGTPVTITTTSLPDGTTGQSYSQTLQASGGTTPYSWSVASGSLPPGLGLNASTGAISGTPTTAGAYSFTARVTDSASPARNATQALNITISAGPLTIATASLPDATVNQGYTQTLQASGGTTPYAWSVPSGSLPPGLGLNASTGTISGTPTAGGTYSFTAQVTDSSVPAQTSTKALSITVATAPTVSVAAITYGLQGAWNQHLLITVALVDNKGNPVAGASLSITLYRNNTVYGSATGTTGTDGKVTFKSTNAPSGCYSTTVTNVTAQGLTWNGNTPANSFCK